MYARNLDGREPVLAVSGLLWNRSLVMLDIQSGSLFHQLSGKAMRGREQGKSLAPIPAQLTDWERWSQLYPDTTMVTLSRTSREYDRRYYQNLGQFVLGASTDKQSRAWPFDELLQQPVVSEEFAGRPVLITYESRSKTALLFDRRIDGRTLAFHWRNGKLRDRETDSIWHPQSGKAISGRLQGRRLKPLPATVSYLEAWKTFYPHSTTFHAQGF